MDAKGKSLPPSMKGEQEPFRRARRKAILDNDEKSIVLLSAHNSCLNSPLDAALPSAALLTGGVASSETQLRNLRMSGSTARLFAIGKQNTHTDNDSPIASPMTGSRFGSQLGRNAGEARVELAKPNTFEPSSPLGSPMAGSRFAKRNEVDDQHAQLLRSYQKKVGRYFPFRVSRMHQTI